MKTKAQNAASYKSNKKKLNYPNLNTSSKRLIGKLNGGFDNALLHLGLTITEQELDSIEEPQEAI